MSNFTKSIVYSAAVLAVGLIAIFAIYNNMAGQSGVGDIEPAAGEQVFGETSETTITTEGEVAIETPEGTPAEGAVIDPTTGETAAAPAEGTTPVTGEAAPATTTAEGTPATPATGETPAATAADGTTPATETPAEGTEPAAGETAPEATTEEAPQ
jgi:hypothetical protein